MKESYKAYSLLISCSLSMIFTLIGVMIWGLEAMVPGSLGVGIAWTLIILMDLIKESNSI